MRQSLALLATLAALLVLGGQVAGDAASEGGRGLVLGLGILLLAAWISGELLAALRLPRICGYLLLGVLLGPGAAAIRPSWFPLALSAEEIASLKLVDGLAISVIAFVAGGEVRLDRLRDLLRQVRIVLPLQSVAVIGGMMLLLPLVVLPRLGGELGAAEPRLAIAAVAALLAFSNSPAVIIAVLKEVRARGPMADLSMTVAVLVDLVLIVLFAMTLFWIVAASGDDAGAAGWTSLAPSLAWHLLGSIALGAGIGAAVRAVARGIPGQLDAFVLVIAFVIAVVAQVAGTAPLLMGLAAGFVQANLRGSGDGLRHAGERLLLPVCCVFFAVAGASVNLASLATLWTAALAIVVVRVVLLWISTTAGASLAGMSAPARWWLWTAFVSQAGLSIGLVGEARRTLAGLPWSDDLATLLLAVIAIHELFGPLVMRLGLTRAGEVSLPAETRSRASPAASLPEPSR